MADNKRGRDEKNKKNDPKSHFWIPDTEVLNVQDKPRVIPQYLDIDHVAHGEILAKGIEIIQQRHRKEKSPISDQLVIFKIQLEEGEQADARGDHKTIFEDNKLKINAITKSNEAIVSTSPQNLKALGSKLRKYIDKNGQAQKFFQYINSISNLEVSDKQTAKLLEEKTKTTELMDIQITLVPKLEEQLYDKMMVFLLEQIKAKNGRIGEDGMYRLSDNTPVLRVILPSSGIDSLIDQEIVLKVEPSPFFDISSQPKESKMDVKDIPLKFNVDPKELPIVCILDDGIELPENMSDCIAGTWSADDIITSTKEHGTKVASRAIFGDTLDQQVLNQSLEPRVRVINAVISDGVSTLYEGTLIRRIQKAVHDIKGITSVFCFAFNGNQIDDSNVGNLAYELDCLSRKGVNFSLPTGNHRLWTVYSTLDEITDDSSSRLESPAEAFFGLSVGSVSRENHIHSLSQKNDLSPFSRIGYGFCGSYKPDLVYPGGNVYKLEDGKTYIAANSAAYVINKEGYLVQEFGTSFSAPIAAADLALLTETVPNKDPLTAKALLIHHAKVGDGTIIEVDEVNEKMYGRGLGSFEDAKNSHRNRATFIRRGKMSRLIKQRIQFWMPSVLAGEAKRKARVAKVTVTCYCLPPVDKNMGSEYLRGYIETSLHAINSNNTSVTKNPGSKKGRKSWHHLHHFSQVFSVFNPGDWQIWLKILTKPEVVEDIEYALVVTIENLTETDVDVYGGIEVEAENRFSTLTEVHVDASVEDAG
ncbi:S8 family peptidase [Paenibacillus alba]|uniref:S8 family peptidase n=1 Tax=Paenibacillus alba TaxID=1197127 RepID=UPI00156465DC|nr:S8 family peptidase [Paenibacillus alba]NQX68504.1 S8 family peptidase [Paenibacillus alba]